jgi:cytochrome b561
MTWQQYVGALVLVLVYARLAWMLVQPRHQGVPATVPLGRPAPA